MAEHPLIALLLAVATQGQTVVVLGAPSSMAGLDRVAAALGATGLLILVGRAPPVLPVAAPLRCLPERTGILSHIADLVAIAAGAAVDWDLLAEECRRMLAPRAWLVAALPPAEALACAASLRAVPFRALTEQRAGGLVLLRARGP